MTASRIRHGVGDKKWRDDALAFTAKGFRPAAIEFFGASRLNEARTWLVRTLKLGLMSNSKTARFSVTFSSMPMKMAFRKVT
jgi:hypothetical protein